MEVIRKKLSFVIVYILVTMIIGMFPIISLATDNVSHPKRILVLNSYHKGYPWTDSIESGIRGAFTSINYNVEFHIEYMDTKEINNAKYYNQLYEIYKTKSYGKKFDAIISTDNDALNFLVKYGEDLFGQTPVIFCGVNNFEDSMLKGKSTFTGVVEDVDIKGTLNTALKLHPNTDEVIIINDKSTTGIEINKTLKNLVPYYKDKAHINFLEGLSISAMREILSNSNPKSIILYVATVVSEDSINRFVGREGIEELLKYTDLPIYVLWDVHMGDGVIGGSITRGKDQGEIAGKLAKRILEGDRVSNIPVITENINRYIFDYEALRKFNIDQGSLPMSSTIINKPSLNIDKNTFYSLITMVISVLLIIIIFLFDIIGKNRKSEKALIESEERYRKLVEISPDGIVVHGLDGKIVYANPCIVEMLEGESCDDLIGKSIMYFIDRESGLIAMEKMSRVEEFRNSNVPSSLKKVKTLKGNSLYIEIISTPISYMSQLDILVVVRDISERKKTEELKKRIEKDEHLLEEARKYDELKTEFFANLSHELRTPLNVILGSIQLLKLDSRGIADEITSNNVERRIRVLKQNCYRLLRLVNNLIDVTRIDANYFELNLKNCDIVNIVEEIALSVSEYISQKNITLIFDTDIEEKIISCDPDKIERIILNLLSNSVKFTNSGGKIEVNTIDMDHSIGISIKDTGIGIKEDKLKIVFDRFRQADKSFTRNHEGSGIGLSLVKSLVELHGGTIKLNSIYGKGSEFFIELPAVTIDTYIKEKNINDKNYVELIDIEFSDIYDLN